MDNDELRKFAKRRLKAQADFKQFLLIWLGVSILLLVIWGITSLTAGTFIYFWPAWPIFGMGIAAFFMGLDAFHGQRVITEADVDAEVERMSRSKGKGAA
jgi:uncharacterized membrane protein